VVFRHACKMGAVMDWWNMKLVELTVGDIAALLLGLGAGISIVRLFIASPC
jgi:hypothetical protein